MRDADEAPEAEAPKAPETEVAAETETVEVETDDKPDGEAEKRKRGLIAELQEERRARKEAMEEAKREREERRKQAEFLQRLMEQQRQPQQPQAPELPPLETDPVEHLKTHAERLARIEAERTQQHQHARLVETLRYEAQKFAPTVPDFAEAYAHLQKSIAAEAEIHGVPPAQIEAWIAETAIARGQNPAEALYRSAAARGYTRAAPAAAPAEKPDTDTLETLERGTKAARGVAASAGSAPQGGLTMEVISSWSPDKFSREYANPKTRAAIIRAMGGGE